LTKIIDKIIWQIRNPHYYRLGKKFDLIVFDDNFPNPVSGFRSSEFLEIMQAFSSVKIIINPVAYKYYGLSNIDFKLHLKHFRNNHSALKSKIKRVEFLNNIQCELIYFVFLNNGRRIVPYLNR
jgi:hypothetical protein